MKQEMTTQDVIKNSIEVKTSGRDWKKVYALLAKLVESDSFRLVRHGNTIFTVSITAPHEAEVFSFNAEKSFKDYIRAVRDFAKALEISGYTKVTARNANVQLINVLKNAGYNVEAEPSEVFNGVQLYEMTATKGAQ